MAVPPCHVKPRSKHCQHPRPNGQAPTHLSVSLQPAQAVAGRRGHRAPHGPWRRHPWVHPRIFWGGKTAPTGTRRGVRRRGSGAGAAGSPAEPSCGDVAGMCVGGRQGGGEGGRGSGRGSSSFDKQLPEHFQTLVLDRHARHPRPCAGPDGAHASGQQVGSPRPAGAVPMVPCHPLERGPPRAAPGPGDYVPWACARPQAAQVPGAGLGCWRGGGDALRAGAGSRGSSQGPAACQGLAEASPWCFVAGVQGAVLGSQPAAPGTGGSCRICWDQLMVPRFPGSSCRARTGSTPQHGAQGRCMWRWWHCHHVNAHPSRPGMLLGSGESRGTAPAPATFPKFTAVATLGSSLTSYTRWDPGVWLSTGTPGSCWGIWDPALCPLL